MSATLGIGIKGFLSAWIRGAGYFDISIHLFLAKAWDHQVIISVGANVTAGITVLWMSASIEFWSGGPWEVYAHPENRPKYSLLDHYMPNSNEAAMDQSQHLPLSPEMYPSLDLDTEIILEDMNDTLEGFKIVTLGDDLYIFYIQDGRLCWQNVTQDISGSVVDAIREGRRLYPSIFTSEYIAGDVRDYDFDVTTVTGSYSSKSAYHNPGTFITVAVLCAGSYDDNGYPLEVENNACLYTMHLWRAPDGALSCSMNADNNLPGYFNWAWIGGRRGVVEFIGAEPIIELAASRVVVGNGDYSYDNYVDVELIQIQKAYKNREQVAAFVSLRQTARTTLSGSRPDLYSLKVKNDQYASTDDDVQSGAGDGYVRVFHRMGVDDSWLAVSRSDKGNGDSGAIEFYDNSMNVAGDDKKSVVLDRANVGYFVQALMPTKDDQFARVIFYTDDVGEDGKRYCLKSLYLEPTNRKGGDGNLELMTTATNYDVNMPTDNFKQQTIAGAVNLYWLSGESKKDRNNATYELYRVMVSIYDPTTNTLSDPTVCAEFRAPDDNSVVRDIFLTPTGVGYMTASPLPVSIGPDEPTDEKTPISLYRFQTHFAPHVTIEGFVFDETLVQPGEFDDYTVSLMNDGNMALTNFELEMLLREGNTKKVVGTLHADCLNPEQSWMKMGNTVVSTGSKAFRRLFDYDRTSQRRDWVVSEKNTKYIIQGGRETDAQETKEQVEYVTTDLVVPGARAGFKSTMQVPVDWEGKKDLELRFSKMTTNTNWVGLMARAANRSTISASRNGLLANDTGVELTYVRDPETGNMVLEDDRLSANAMVKNGLFASVIEQPKDFKIESIHDLHVSHNVHMGPHNEKWLSISFFDYAQTGEPIKLYAEMYLDDAEEPLRLSLPYYEDAVSDGMTHTYDMPLAALVDPTSCRTARVVIKGVGIEDRGLADNEFTLYLDGEAGPLMIISQPRDVTCKVGDTASFSVTASGGATPYHYQWQVWMGEKKGWVDLDGAVISALIVKDVTMAMSGRKARCIVTDSSGQKIISDAATLTVINPQMVDTGDHSNLPLYLAVALAALALIWLLRRRTRQGE